MVINALIPLVSQALHAPQAKTWRDLLYGADGAATLLEPRWPAIGVVLYLLLESVGETFCKRLATTGKSPTFKRVALVHNIALCLFSLSASVSVWILVLEHSNNSLESILCEGTAWNAGLYKWGLLFYFSKYWELFDTALLIWKRRSPSFLQVYHHSATIIGAYMLQASHSPATFLFVGLNATVHTIMYAYYALTITGIRSPLKPFITIIQIIQFIVGNSLASLSFYYRNGQCLCESQKIATGAMIAHATFLIFLFLKFYRKTYLRPSAKTAHTESLSVKSKRS